jgi:hypothetical protein
MNLLFVTLVSGLPRSGTSMMMQMIEAGGIPALTDHQRKQDEDNPKGYYELEPVKKTKDDPSWVPAARGKVVKVIYSLLYDLPREYEYRVIFMERNIYEVIASQTRMLQRSGKKGANLSDDKLAELYKAQLNKFNHWIRNQCCFTVLPVNYSAIVESPQLLAEKINSFLGGGLDTGAMVRSVDPSLYRNKR